MLLDEPMAGLDGNTYARLLDALPGLVGHSGATVVVVTHNPEEAFRLCDDIVILVNGRVRTAGTRRRSEVQGLSPTVDRDRRHSFRQESPLAQQVASGNRASLSVRQ